MDEETINYVFVIVLIFLLVSSLGEIVKQMFL